MVAGVGLTTGTVNSGAPDITPKLTSAAFAQAYADGWCAVVEAVLTGSVIADGNLISGIIGLDVDYDPFVWSRLILCGPSGYAITGPGVIQNGVSEASISGFPVKFGTRFDAVTGEHITSLDGSAGPTSTTPGSYGGIAEILLNNALYNPDGNCSVALERVRFYNPTISQGALNSLTVV